MNLAKQSIGKIIEWSVEGYAARYGGKAVITAITDDERPLVTKTIEGDDLSFACLEDFGVSLQEGYLKNDEGAPHVFSYSDADRYVEVLSVEDNG